MGIAAEDDIARLRPTRDKLGKHGDLFMRLSGFYWVGPNIGVGEPEFGYRDMRDSELRGAIQQEAANALAELSDRLSQ